MGKPRILRPARLTAAEFVALNPGAYGRLLYHARRLKAASRTGRVSMKACFECVRAEAQPVTTTQAEGSWRLDNSMTSGLARYIRERCPDLRTSFEVRASKHDKPVMKPTMPRKGQGSLFEVAA